MLTLREAGVLLTLPVISTILNRGEIINKLMIGETTTHLSKKVTHQQDPKDPMKTEAVEVEEEVPLEEAVK